MDAAELEDLRARARSIPLHRETPGAPTRHAVTHSREFTRIRAIPIHPGYTDEQRDMVRHAVTKPGATLRLWDSQCDALLGAIEAGGLFGPLPVGAGKSLVAALLPTVLAKRTIILTTATLKKQLELMLADYRASFYLRSDFRVMAYSRLSTLAARDALEQFAPEMIVADEAHALRSKDSARTKRLARFIAANPRTLFVALSGSMTKRSVVDFARLLSLALKDWSPLPRDFETLKEWSEALDPPKNGAAPRAPGALLEFCQGSESVRAGFRRRLYSTRGVVGRKTPDPIESELVVEVEPWPTSPAIEAARLALFNNWARPDGEQLTTAMAVSEVDRQLRLGGWYGWVEPPDRAWLKARSDYHRAIRAWLSDHRRNTIDSPLALANALSRGEIPFERYPDLVNAYESWQDLKHIKPPPTAWFWTDPIVATFAACRVLELRPCVLFAGRIGWGRAVAALAGIPFYGEGAADAVAILSERGNRSIVASLDSHGQGRNLQCFARAILADPPPTGARLEQFLGRLHRPGQASKTTTYHVPDLFEHELQRAHADARWLEETTGAPKKINRARIVGGEKG